MVNAEHLEILKSGVENWNKWRKEKKEIRPDLSYANLSGINLSNIDLRDTYLSGTILRHSNLNNARFNGAFLGEADLLNAVANEASFYGANLIKANLEKAQFFRTDFTEAELTGAILIKANLIATDLFRTNLLGANFNNADLSRANLREANFTKSEIGYTNFSESELNWTIFGYTNLSTCIGLETVRVLSPCVIDFPTLRASKNLPKEFLTKLGIPDLLMEYLPDFYNPALMIYPAFLSHSWNDKVFVRKLYEALTRKGVTVWLDEKKMKPGDNIHDSISEGIKYYDKLILVCSENSLNSWWVEKELERVYEKERELQKERGKKYRLVIPIRIDDSIFNCTDGILGTVKGSLIGDFTRWQDEQAFERAVKELVDALNANRVDIEPPSFL